MGEGVRTRVDRGHLEAESRQRQADRALGRADIQDPPARRHSRESAKGVWNLCHALVDPPHSHLARRVADQDRRVEPEARLGGEALVARGVVEDPCQVIVKIIQRVIGFGIEQEPVVEPFDPLVHGPICARTASLRASKVSSVRPVRTDASFAASMSAITTRLTSITASWIPVNRGSKNRLTGQRIALATERRNALWAPAPELRQPSLAALAGSRRGHRYSLAHHR